MTGEHSKDPNQTPHFSGNDAEDRVVTALNHLRDVLSGGGSSHWQADSFRQKACLTEWAKDLGLYLDPDAILPLLKKGGQEHDYFYREDSARCVKVTREGVFGLTPGIDLALVAAGQDARRFQLWEASPFQYLERLRLQNLITPELNRLEGVFHQNEDLAIVISQPRFDLNYVTQVEIDEWFEAQGFTIITKSAYYRPENNLAIFDAHDRNVVRSTLEPSILIPFDVIPVQPDGGFLKFIEETLAAGHSLEAVRSSRTTSRSPSAK
jgi:hypothetical protein